jgi:hypothetical protein
MGRCRRTNSHLVGRPGTIRAQGDYPCRGHHDRTVMRPRPYAAGIALDFWGAEANTRQVTLVNILAPSETSRFAMSLRPAGLDVELRKGIPLRAYENNQFRSVAKATPYGVVRCGGLLLGRAARGRSGRVWCRRG